MSRVVGEMGETESFEDVLAACVSDGFGRVLGQSGTQAVMFHIDYPRSSKDLNEFHRRLVGLFGEIGTHAREIKIVSCLSEKLKDPSLVPSNGASFDLKGIIKRASAAHSKRGRR
jgi:hypothetical protein